MRGEAENSITIISVQRIPNGQLRLARCARSPQEMWSGSLGQVLNLPAEKIAELFKETFWQEISPGEMNRLLHLLLEKVEVHESKLTVEFKSSGIKTLMEEIANGEETD